MDSISSLWTDVENNGMIRLADGASETEGRVEVFYNGRWGTVCDDSFGEPDVQVVCRQLGYNAFGVTLEVPPGSGAIWMDDLECSGDEKSLSLCQFAGWGIENCSHEEDVGVRCFSEEKGMFFLIVSEYINYHLQQK